MKKSLLILGAGIESVEGYLKIKKFNCKIIVVDKNPKAPGVKYADIFIRSSIHNFKEILKKLLQKKIKIDGVLSFGDVSYIANRLSKYFKTESIPLKRAGNVGDVANLCAYLASDKASYITGQIIKVDGGLVT